MRLRAPCLGIQAGQHLPAADIPVSAAHRSAHISRSGSRGWNQALAAGEQRWIAASSAIRVPVLPGDRHAWLVAAADCLIMW